MGPIVEAIKLDRAGLQVQGMTGLEKGASKRLATA